MNECPTQKSKLVKLQEGGKKILHFCFPPSSYSLWVGHVNQILCHVVFKWAEIRKLISKYFVVTVE